MHILGVLSHWGRDKMDTISQTTLSNAFSWMTMLEFRLTFHRSLFLGVQLTIFQHWFRRWLGANQATSHYLNQWWLDYRRIYASLGLNELYNHFSHSISVQNSLTILPFISHNQFIPLSKCAVLITNLSFNEQKYQTSGPINSHN